MLTAWWTSANKTIWIRGSIQIYNLKLVSLWTSHWKMRDVKGQKMSSLDCSCILMQNANPYQTVSLLKIYQHKKKWQKTSPTLSAWCKYWKLLILFSSTHPNENHVCFSFSSYFINIELEKSSQNQNHWNDEDLYFLHLQMQANYICL